MPRLKDNSFRLRIRGARRGVPRARPRSLHFFSALTTCECDFYHSNISGIGLKNGLKIPFIHTKTRMGKNYFYFYSYYVNFFRKLMKKINVYKLLQMFIIKVFLCIRRWYKLILFRQYNNSISIKIRTNHWSRILW